MKKLTKKEKVLLGVSIVGLGVAGYFGLKYLNKKPKVSDVDCPLCSKGTQCISDVNFEGYNASVRLDLDFNQIDCELVRIDPETGAIFGEWSMNPLNIKYCPECGIKLPDVED